MKKLLSLILAIIMIVSTVPMAFAVEFEHETYVDAFVEFMTYTINVYESDETLSSSDKLASNLLYLMSICLSVTNEYPEIDSLLAAEPEQLLEFPEAGNAYIDAFNEGIKYYEDLIADGTFVIRIKTDKFTDVYYRALATYGQKKVDNLIAKIPIELTEKSEESAKKIDNFEVHYIDSYTQADFDKEIEYAVAYWTQVNNCLGGKHSISYNPATDNGDGTHTFTCAFCTDIATAEHSFIDGKCVCGVEEPITDDGNDEVVEDKTESEDDNTDFDDNTQEPEKTSIIKQLVQKISNFFKSILEKLRSLVKR